MEKLRECKTGREYKLKLLPEENQYKFLGFLNFLKQVVWLR
jgi:hypothetical protein